MIRRSGMLKNIALLLFGVFVALVLVESALRVTGWLFLQARVPARLSSSSDPAGTIRVLCLGESTTADMELLGTQSYPAQLERILNERSGSDRFVVINRGVPATTTDRIVKKLPTNLDEQEPDIVVTMMGVNDGPLADPLFVVDSGASSLRVLKLARMLYASWFGSAPRPEVEEEDSPQVATIKHTDGLPKLKVPGLTMFSLKASAMMMMEGHFDDAEELLIPLSEGPLEGDMRHVASAAVGQLVLLNYQRGEEASAAKYHQQYRELMDIRQNPKTTVNYTTLRKLVAQRGVPLVAVQYPGRSVGQLRQVLGDAANIAFVDNETTFIDAAKNGPLKELYRDLFGGIFGHLTPHGNELLASNVADVILELVQSSNSTTLN